MILFQFAQHCEGIFLRLAFRFFLCARLGHACRRTTFGNVGVRRNHGQRENHLVFNDGAGSHTILAHYQRLVIRVRAFRIRVRHTLEPKLYRDLELRRFKAALAFQCEHAARVTRDKIVTRHVAADLEYDVQFGIGAAEHRRKPRHLAHRHTALETRAPPRKATDINVLRNADGHKRVMIRLAPWQCQSFSTGKLLFFLEYSRKLKAPPCMEMPMPASPPLILASTSVYRRELLARLGVVFETQAPEVDETADPGEQVAAMVARLAAAKAHAVAGGRETGVVIGSDQAASLDGVALGKPGGKDTARRQLRSLSGRAVSFHTGLCVIDAATGSKWESMDETVVKVRDLSDAEIDRYLAAEQPFDCAGSFKSEGLGIALFDAIETSDPTALIGLPLIAVCRHLRAAGFNLP